MKTFRINALTLASRNVRRSVRDYGVYFLTIVMGVAMFYVFNSIAEQGVMMELSKNQAMMLLGVNRIMSVLSVFIAAILGFLILYANAFLIRRRKKELGVYMTLGMKKGKVSQVLIYETALVGIASLAAGLAAGIFVSQACALLTAKLFGVGLKAFAFIFSAPALLKSIVYFGAAFLIVMLFNTANISRRQLVDLIYAEKKTEKFRAPRLGASAGLFVISVIMLAAAYFLAFSAGVYLFGGVHYTVAVLGAAGTFLFFYAFSGFLLRLIPRFPGLRFKGLNLFTLGQLRSRMSSAHLTISFVCLMLLLSITSISLGSALAESIKGYDQREAGTVAAITYMSLYIGIVFMIACASVLAIAQLSEASDNRSRYRLLAELGAGEKMLAGSLFRQILIYFALPLILAVIHSAAAIAAMSKIIALIGEINIPATCLVSGLAIIALYGGYFLLTYLSARNFARGGP